MNGTIYNVDYHDCLFGFGEDRKLDQNAFRRLIVSLYYNGGNLKVYSPDWKRALYAIVITKHVEPKRDGKHKDEWKTFHAEEKALPDSVIRNVDKLLAEYRP